METIKKRKNVLETVANLKHAGQKKKKNSRKIFEIDGAIHERFHFARKKKKEK